jgi:urea-proton symporter
MLPITKEESGAGLVPPAVASFLLGDAGSALILVMLFMAIVSTGSAESIAVSSLVAYDIYRQYINPEATGADIVKVSRIVIVAFGLFNGVFSIVLHEAGLNLGWVYLFMGITIGSAVCPLWNLMTWTKASGTGAVIAAWGGLVLALIGWLVAAQIQSGEITVASLGANEVMLSGNLIAIISSGVIHYVYSVFIDPQDYDFAELDQHIKLVEDDTRGLTDAEKDPHLLDKADRWIKRRGYVLTIVLIVIWPLLSVPAGVFTKSYFAFWVLIAMAWGFGAAITLVVLPLSESQEDIGIAITGMYNAVSGRKPERPAGYDETTGLVNNEAPAGKTVEDGVEPPKQVEEHSEEIDA